MVWAYTLGPMQVLRISSRDTFKIRQLMLRPNGTLQDCEFKGDEDELTFHLGAFIDKKLVSVASFYFEKHPDIAEPYQFRLRGMATLPEHQGQGLSSALLKTAFPMIKQNLCKVLWCNARVSAIGFYTKVGFKQLSGEFEIPGIGPHTLMSITIE